MEQLDDKVRDAMRALEGRVPARYFDELSTRIAARLEDVEMQSEIDGSEAADREVPPPLMAVTEDSGLHDIKALAQTQKQRISKRISTQSDVADALLAASSSGLHMVALPEPARMVSLPSVSELAPARAAASPVEAPPRRKPAIWIGAAIGLAAAVAAGVLVIGGGTKVAEPTASKPAAPASPVVASTPTPTKVETVPAVPQAPPVAPSEPTVAVLEPEAAVPAAAPVAAAEGRTDTERARDRSLNAATVAAKDDKATAKPADKNAAKVDPGAPAKPVELPKAPAGGGAATIDDLLDQASGGLGSAKPKADPHEAKPAKTELSRDDIKKGMGGAQGDAQGCFDSFGIAGTVKIKATVAPSGAVTKAEATGEFAGTPTGRCVAAAVKSVSFPSWEGAPMTINYSYLLSE